MSHEDKKATVCVLETQKGTRQFFRDLLSQMFAYCDTADLRGRVEVVSNATFSELLEYYDQPKKTLPDLFRKIELLAAADEFPSAETTEAPDGSAGAELDADSGVTPTAGVNIDTDIDTDDEAEGLDAQFIVDMIGELAAEATEEIAQPGYIVFPDPVYGPLLGFFADNYGPDEEIQVLTMSDFMHSWLQECVFETNQPLPWFGIIGGYGLCNELATATDDFDSSVMGRRLPNDSYRIIETFLRPDWSNREQVEDLFVDQVRKLHDRFGVRQILIADETLECTLLGLSEDMTAEGYYVAFLHQEPEHRYGYLTEYRAAWQTRMQHLYHREDWPSGVRLESALTIYAEAIVAQVAQDYLNVSNLKN